MPLEGKRNAERNIKNRAKLYPAYISFISIKIPYTELIYVMVARTKQKTW